MTQIGLKHISVLSASDAAAGIGSAQLRQGSTENAMDSMISDINEIEPQFITAKLIRNLSSAFLLNKNLPAAALTSIYGLTNIKPGVHYFESLLAHMDQNYANPFLALQNYLENRKEPYSTLPLRQLIEEVSNLRVENAECEHSQIILDLATYAKTGAICLEEQEKDDIPLTNSETLTARLAEAFENTIRYFFHNLQETSRMSNKIQELLKILKM